MNIDKELFSEVDNFYKKLKVISGKNYLPQIINILDIGVYYIDLDIMGVHIFFNSITKKYKIYTDNIFDENIFNFVKKYKHYYKYLCFYLIKIYNQSFVNS